MTAKDDAIAGQEQDIATTQQLLSSQLSTLDLIRAIVEAGEPEPEPEEEPTPTGKMYEDGQGWYQKKGEPFPKHVHCATYVPREPQSGIIEFDIEAVVHRVGRHGVDWEWDKLDTKAVTMASGGKAEVSGDFKSLLKRFSSDGLTELWRATITFDTRDLHDGRRRVKIRQRIKFSDGDVLGVTLGFNITTQNGNPEKDSPDRYTNPERLFIYGYWRTEGEKPIYASPRVFGDYPSNAAPDILVYDYRTKSWQIGKSGDRTIRHAIRLDMRAHDVPLVPGESLLPSGNLWDAGNAGKNDVVDIDTTGWSVGAHHVAQIVEARGQDDGSVLTGIMRHRLEVE